MSWLVLGLLQEDVGAMTTYIEDLVVGRSMTGISW